MGMFDNEDFCRECGESDDHLEWCSYFADRMAEVTPMTMSEAIEHIRFNGNCYCLTSLREIEIVDLADRSKPKADDAKPVKLLNDKQRVAKFQKDRAHIYRRPERS